MVSFQIVKKQGVWYDSSHKGVSNMNTGIAGAGSILPAFLEAQAKIPQMHVKAVCATRRSKGRLEMLAREHGIERIYCDYEEMVKDEKLDVIYVAVPNHLHYSFARQALLAGKSVLCEKPFCTSMAQAEELAALAKEKGLCLFEAISNQYFPNYEKVRELLPNLGAVKIVEINYSQYSSRYDAFKRGEILPVFDPEKSGGALMDLNVYNIHFILGLFGEPEEIRYFANMERGIDTSGVLILKYPGFVCTSVAAKDCKAPCCINIQGDKGCIHSDSPANVFQSFRYENNAGESRVYELNERRERLYYELKAFAELAEGRDPQQGERQLAHSLLVQKVLDEARRQQNL